MSSEIFSERLYTVTEVARKLPHRPHPSSVWRWVLKGARGNKLRSVLVGGRRLIPESAIDEFIAACTAVGNGEMPPARTPRQRERDVKQAERELARAGI